MKEEVLDLGNRWRHGNSFMLWQV